jgi:hypothetical protein
MNKIRLNGPRVKNFLYLTINVINKQKYEIKVCRFDGSIHCFVLMS